MAPKTVPANTDADIRMVRTPPMDDVEFLKFGKWTHDIMREIANQANNYDRGRAKTLLDLFTGDATYKPSLAISDATDNAEVIELLSQVSNPHKHSFNNHNGAVLAKALKDGTITVNRL